MYHHSNRQIENGDGYAKRNCPQAIVRNPTGEGEAPAPNPNSGEACTLAAKGQFDRVNVSRIGTLPPVSCPGSQGSMPSDEQAPDFPQCCGR